MAFRDLWNNVKCNNIHFIEIQKGEKREQVIENLSQETMSENFSNLVKENVTQA